MASMCVAGTVSAQPAQASNSISLCRTSLPHLPRCPPSGHLRRSCLASRTFVRRRRASAGEDKARTQVCPVFGETAIKALLAMASKMGRSDSMMALDALKDSSVGNNGATR